MYCLSNPNKVRCNAHNSWGGGLPNGCCPDVQSFAEGWFNVDLVPIGVPLTIPGKYVTPTTPVVLPPVDKPAAKNAGILIVGALLLGYGAYKAMTR